MPPGEPYNLTVLSIETVRATLSWQQPLDTGEPGIASYTVIAMEKSSGHIVTASTANNDTEMTVTNLKPDVVYQFRVQAVAKALDVTNPGEFSEPVEAATKAEGNKTMIQYSFHLLIILSCVAPYFQLKLTGINDCKAWRVSL